MKKTLYTIGTLLVVLAIILLATKSNDNLSVATSVVNQEQAVQKATKVQTAPAFSLEDLSGTTISLADYQGVKPVILDFWATWCPNCQRDMPRLNVYYEKYKDKVEVIGINLQENKSLVAKFVEQKGLTFPIVLDPASIASRSYGVRYTNYHVLIDINGNIVTTVPGDIRESDIQALIN